MTIGARVGVAAAMFLLMFTSVAGGQTERESTLHKFVRVVGTAQALDADPDVRERVAPYRTVVGQQSTTEAEVKEVPRECGRQVLDVFLSGIGKRFAAGGVGSCGAVPVSGSGRVRMTCATTYIAGYQRVFLSFNYEHVAKSHVKLVLEAKQRSPAGAEFPASQVLTPDDQKWMLALNQTLGNALVCGG